MAKETNNEEFVKRCRLRNKTDKKLINDVALSMASKTALRVIAIEALERESNACGRLEQLQYDLETEEKAHETTRGEWQKHRWIPVSERLPKARTKVLTLGPAEPPESKSEPAVAWMGEDSKTWWTYGNDTGFYKPTYWKPIILPEAEEIPPEEIERLKESDDA